MPADGAGLLHNTPYRESRIIQTPTMLAILNEDLTYRQIYMDGRELGEGSQPDLDGLFGGAIGTATRWWWIAMDSAKAPGWTLTATLIPRACA